MADWPGNPIATLRVEASVLGRGIPGKSAYSALLPGTALVAPNAAFPTQQALADPLIKFRVKCEYNNSNAAPITAFAVFRVNLQRYDGTGYTLIDAQTITLGGGKNFYSSEIALSVTMVDPSQAEQYLVTLHAEEIGGQLSSFPGDSWTPLGLGILITATQEIFYQAIMDQYLGDFSLDFFPVTIVYSPPGKNMTASLLQSQTFGTRFQIGTSSGMEVSTGLNIAFGLLGYFATAFNSTNSISVSNKSASGIQLSSTLQTQITADNAVAIGPTHWGPLGDIFVIAVNPRFAASQQAKGTIFYSLKTIRQILLIPAWKLLRPGDDPIAKRIPSAARKEMLKLDPFITSLDKFFPDSGADLGVAANPFADPSANNRAELVSRNFLDEGTEIAYQLGQQQQLSGTQSNDLGYTATATVDATGSTNSDTLKVGLGLNSQNKTTLVFSGSKETNAALIRSASCFLARQDGDPDLDGIAVYFDKVFSTFMFRRINTALKHIPVQPAKNPPFVLPTPASSLGPIGPGAVSGTVSSSQGAAVLGITVQIIDTKDRRRTTTVGSGGAFWFFNLPLGRYKLTVGGRTVSVTVSSGCDSLNPVEIHIRGARRILDFKDSPVWELEDALGIPSRVLKAVSRRLRSVSSLAELASLLDAGPPLVQRWKQTALFPWDQNYPRGTTGKPPARNKRKNYGR